MSVTLCRFFFFAAAALAALGLAGSSRAGTITITQANNSFEAQSTTINAGDGELTANGYGNQPGNPDQPDRNPVVPADWTTIAGTGVAPASSASTGAGGIGVTVFQPALQTLPSGYPSNYSPGMASIGAENGSYAVGDLQFGYSGGTAGMGVLESQIPLSTWTQLESASTYVITAWGAVDGTWTADAAAKGTLYFVDTGAAGTTAWAANFTSTIGAADGGAAWRNTGKGTGISGGATSYGGAWVENTYTLTGAQLKAAISGSAYGDYLQIGIGMNPGLVVDNVSIAITNSSFPTETINYSYPLPEPSSAVLWGIAFAPGLGGLCWRRRRLA